MSLGGELSAIRTSLRPNDVYWVALNELKVGGELDGGGNGVGKAQIE